MNQYRSTGQAIGTPSVKVTLTDDLYLNLHDEPATPRSPVVASGSSSSRSSCGCGSAVVMVSALRWRRSPVGGATRRTRCRARRRRTMIASRPDVTDAEPGRRPVPGR